MSFLKYDDDDDDGEGEMKVKSLPPCVPLATSQVAVYTHILTCVF